MGVSQKNGDQLKRGSTLGDKNIVDHLSCSVTLEKKGTLFGEDNF